jgi:hypothetical protein
MSDEWKAFVSLGSAFAARDTVSHSAREYAHGPVHTNSAEGFNDRVRSTVSGVFHHISPHLTDPNFNETGFRWSQRVVTGRAPRQRCSFQPCSASPLAARCDGPKRVGSTSSPKLLCLLDNGGNR